MEIRHIRYFIALAEELNFSRAAKRLHIAQPPLSRQIKELEEQIGAQLFYRTKRHVELTNAGKVFRKNAYQILDQVEQARISARLSSTGTEGEFRIGFTGAVHDIIPTIQVFREQYPDVGIILKHMSTAEQIEALNENRIDIALISSPINHNKIKVTPVRKMRFVVALPEQHALSSKQTIYLNDLKDETFIMTPKSVGALYYETFMSVFDKASFTPNITIQAHDLHTVLALVSAGMGITLTPSPTSSVSGIIKRQVEDVNLEIEGLLAWHQDNRSEILEKFLTFLSEVYYDDRIKLQADKT